MNFYGKSENIYFRRVEDSEQTTTATTTTSQPTTTTTASTTQSTTTTQTTIAQTTTASASTTAPVTTTPEGGNPDKPDMSEFYGSWLQFKAVVEGKEIEVPENELIQAVITSDHIYRTGSRESKWEPEEDGKSLLVNGMWKIRLDGDVLVFTEIDGTEYHFRHGEKPVSFGDPNNDSKIDANDASFVLVQYAKMSTGGEATMTEAEKSAADINKDGKVDAKDASVALAYYSYLSTGGTDKLEVYLGYEEADVPVKKSEDD
ncbi:MAG: hypothetical protein J6U16_01960 [Ruminococcus sp.]|nr:hypothetical protein [Ruminococcus sp.]